MSDEKTKAPWYTSRTIWFGVLAAAVQILQVIPLAPEIRETLQAGLAAMATVLGASKARDVLGPK